MRETDLGAIPDQNYYFSQGKVLSHEGTDAFRFTKRY
jgi:hypothetical protein